MKQITALLLALTFTVAPAQAARAEALRDDAHVTTMLVAAQVGDILRNSCPQVSARRITVLTEMLALQSHAKSKGHTDATIRAFLDDAAEKKRIRDLADAYLNKSGIKTGDVASYCSVARAEVAARTVTGRLIRVAQ